MAQRTTPASMAAKGLARLRRRRREAQDGGRCERDAAGKAFDDLKASGRPVHGFIRTVDAAGTASDWNPVGGIAVPRSNSEEQALAMAIFNNEDDLLKGAYRAYPKLKVTSDKFEYGYRMREFPDDPIKIADPEATKESDNPLVNWFNQLDNPFNRD